MSLEIEKKKEKTFNCFPLRTNITPKYIILDTTTIIHLLFEKKHGNKGDYLTEGNVIKKRDEIWKNFFRIEKKNIFGNVDTSYHFNYQIQTDGIGVSILQRGLF